jgi:hypothetical protein
MLRKSAFAFAFLLTASVVAHATTLNTDLIINGDAELGSGSATGGTVAVPGSNTANGFTAVQYGASGGFPDATVSTAIGGGTNFFAGGPNSTTATASQSLDVSDLASSIDAGTLSLTLSGYMGGFETQGDNMAFAANFLGASSNALGSMMIGPVTEIDRAGVTTLLLRTGSNAIPVGTRAILFVLTAMRTDGTYNDGYGDNFSAMIVSSASIAPEPTTWSLLLLGFAATMLARLKQLRRPRVG